MKKRVIALVCLAAICFGMLPMSSAQAAVSRAAPATPPGRWVNTSSISLNITFSSGTASCTGRIYGFSNVNKIEATFELQKKNASGSFDPYYTWPKVTVNSDYLSWSGSRSVSTGVYRLQVIAVVTNTSNISERIVTYCEKEYK